jgi:peptide/nickel transport system permease protein
MSAVEPSLGVDFDAAQPDRRRKPPLLLGAAALVLLAVIVCAIFGAQLAPQDPRAQDLLTGLAPPGHGHLLGTDDLGRDVFSGIVAGARTALVGPLIIAVGAMAIGTLLGVTAGYLGGRVDAVLMRWVDLMYSLPGLFVAIVVAGVLGGGYWMAVALLTVLTAPNDTRLIRGTTLEQRTKPYVEAAQGMGLSDARIMARHVFPNVLPVIVANTFLSFAFALVSLAALSFLGLGVDPGTPDWGRMLFDSRSLLFTNPWTALAPAGIIVLTVVSINLLGDGVFEALSDRGVRR